MKAITVQKINHLQNYILEIEFSDGCIKHFDFSMIVAFNGIAEALKEVDYFKNVSIINGGRAFGWENGYDCCADWARYYAPDLAEEWKDTAENVGLKQRIVEAQKRIQQKTDLDHVA